MTKTLEDVEKFIELRARGYSFDRIAEETGISKPVLLKWQGEYSARLKEQKYFEMENIINQYNIMRLKRFETVTRLLSVAYKEMEERTKQKEMETLPVGKLLELVVALEARLEKETDKVMLGVSVNEGEKFLQMMNKEFVEVE